MDPAPLSIVLTPHGRLVINHDTDAPALPAGLPESLTRAFERGPGHGLLLLGVDEAGAALPPVAAYWREFGARYIGALCTTQNGSVAPLEDAEFAPVSG